MSRPWSACDRPAGRRRSGPRSTNGEARMTRLRSFESAGCNEHPFAPRTGTARRFPYPAVRELIPYYLNRSPCGVAIRVGRNRRQNWNLHGPAEKSRFSISMERAGARRSGRRREPGRRALQSPPRQEPPRRTLVLAGTRVELLASAGGSFFWVMFGQLLAKSAFILSHCSSPGSVSGLIASTGHSGSHTPQRCTRRDG